MSWTLLTSEAIILKAGFQVNKSASTSGAFMKKLADWSEGALIRDTEYNWVRAVSEGIIIGEFLPALEDACSDYAGKFLIEPDMGGYTNNGEAVTMVNILIENYGKAVSSLKDKNVQVLARGGLSLS